MANENQIAYCKAGDYNMPNLILSPKEANVDTVNGVSECRWHSNKRTDRAGRRDLLRKAYLIKNKKILFFTLLAEGKLWQYLSNVDAQAQLIVNLSNDFEKLIA